MKARVSTSLLSKPRALIRYRLAAKGSIHELIHIRKVQLDEERILKIAKQVAVAMQYLHKKEVMHCNLKSSNILVTNLSYDDTDRG